MQQSMLGLWSVESGKLCTHGSWDIAALKWGSCYPMCEISTNGYEITKGVKVSCCALVFKYIQLTSTACHGKY